MYRYRKVDLTMLKKNYFPNLIFLGDPFFAPEKTIKKSVPYYVDHCIENYFLSWLTCYIRISYKVG